MRTAILDIDSLKARNIHGNLEAVCLFASYSVGMKLFNKTYMREADDNFGQSYSHTVHGDNRVLAVHQLRLVRS